MIKKEIPYVFGAICEYYGKKHRYIGMSEDGALIIAVQQDESPFSIVDVEQVWLEGEEWEGGFKMLEASPIEDPFAWVTKYKTFKEKFKEKHKLCEERFMKMINDLPI